MRRAIVAIAILVPLACSSSASATTCGEVIGYHADVYIEQTGTTCHVAEVLFESGVDIRRPPAVFTIAPFKCWNHGIRVGSPTFIEGARRRIVFCVGRRSSVQITLATHPVRRCRTEAGPIPGTQVENCRGVRR